MTARPEHEQALVGALLTWHDVAVPDLDPSDFTAPSLGRIFGWVRDRGDQPRELGVLAADLGDDLFTVAAEAMTQAAGASTVPDLAQRVRTAATERRARAIGRDLLEGKLSPAEARRLLDQLDQPTTSQAPPRFCAESPDEIPAERLRWLLRGWLMRGVLHMVAGRPKVGKTTAVAAMMAALSRGQDLLGAPVDPVRCGWLTLEEPKTIVAARLRALGADASRALVVSTQGGPLAIPRDLAALRAFVEGEGLELLVVDGLGYAVGARAESYQALGSVLSELAAAAEASDCAVLGIAHTPKGGASADAPIIGSTAWTGVSRLVAIVTEQLDENGEDRGGRVLVRTQGGYGEAHPLGFRIVEDAVTELGVAVGWHVARMDPADAFASREDRAERNALAQAVLAAIEDAGGELPRKDLPKALRAQGFTSLGDKAILAAIRTSGARLERRGFQAGYVLVAPNHGTPAEEPREPRSLDGLPRLPERHALLRLWDATPETRELAAVVGAQLLAAWRAGRTVTVADLIGEYGASRDELRRVFGALRVRVVREVVEPLPEAAEVLEYEEVGA